MLRTSIWDVFSKSFYSSKIFYMVPRAFYSISSILRRSASSSTLARSTNLVSPPDRLRSQSPGSSFSPRRLSSSAFLRAKSFCSYSFKINYFMSKLFDYLDFKVFLIFFFCLKIEAAAFKDPNYLIECRIF